MSEGERAGAAPVSTGGEAAIARPHQRLPELVELAFNERDDAEQRRLTTELIDTLVEMRKPGDEAEEAALLVAQLEAKRLRRLVDRSGRSAHREAVETLLSLGFPHALKVSPEDLERYRDHGELGGELLARVNARTQASWLALGTHTLGMTYWALARPDAATPWLFGSATLGVAGALMLRAVGPREGIGLPVTLLGLSAAAAFMAGLASLPLLGVLAGMLVAAAVARTGHAEHDDV